MKGDFSKMTFAPDKHFLRVLMQQGRVQLDADWNEQAAILLHYMQTLATDLIGPYAGPEGDSGFEITKINEGRVSDFSIGEGRYYVDGVLCENHTNVTYLNQPDYPLHNDPDTLRDDGAYLAYLDVWERHICSLEDDDVREKALNGVDTATRSKVIWQVKVKKLDDQLQSYIDGVSALNDEVVLSEVCLSARVKPDEVESDACCQHPDAKYRGAENQLYRIEIHKVDTDKFTFKWSRENGAVAFSVNSIVPDAETKTMTVELEHLGRDDKLKLAVNDWVELMDDDSVLKNKANPLLQINAIDPITRTVKLSGISPISYDKSKHPLLRRWDQKDDAEGITVATKSVTQTPWLPIESGIQVQFQFSGKTVLRTGDYWIIPARTNTGEVEWPTQTDAQGNHILPAAKRPYGVEHHYAPLAIINVSDNENTFHDYRCSFKPLSSYCKYSYYGRLGRGIGTDLLCSDN